MSISNEWVALLDEDEDDYVFWRHGFHSWAAHLDIHWFPTVSDFLAATGLSKSKPAALLLDGVVPSGEEIKWLSTLLLHPSCQGACFIMLSAQAEDHQHEAYLRLGATDHLIKPINLVELQLSVSTVSRHISARNS